MADFQSQCSALINQKGSMTEQDRLQRCFELVWDTQMAQFPENATGSGYPRYQDRWTDWSNSAIERRKAHPSVIRTLLESFDWKSLSETDRLSIDLLARQADITEEEGTFHELLMPISQMHGVQHWVSRTLELMALEKREYRQAALARIERIPELIDQTIALMERGLARGVTPPKVCMRDVPNQIRALVTATPEDSPVLACAAKRPGGVSKSDWDSFCAEGSTLCAEKATPAFGRLLSFVEQTYLPGCTEETGWLHMPDGEAWYRFLVRRETTTDLTPDEIFEIGLSEVKRIRGEMDEVIRESGFTGSFDEFCEFLRTDPKFYYDTAEGLVTAYRDIAKRADPELAKLFGTLPRLPYGVTPIPAHLEKSETTAYYQPGAPSAGRPGYYYVNTYDLKSRPKWEMEALSLHEAVPGHHLQIARMQELEDLPEFRRQSWITAYGEGWALYSESLGSDMGFYKEPYSRFGQLTYDMWRAIRLVVDPGMHYKGWTREQAIEFFRQNSSKSLHDITVEIDRYLVWPGQALAYKIGQLRIQKLRAEAEQGLGERFDVRAFHDMILECGCVPLKVLEKRAHAWIEDR
ncbi:DUF885 domain-containing protein [bacterium]|nr:DUF885 domain-containing protein [bacterium]